MRVDDLEPSTAVTWRWQRVARSASRSRGAFARDVSASGPSPLQGEQLPTEDRGAASDDCARSLAPRNGATTGRGERSWRATRRGHGEVQRTHRAEPWRQLRALADTGTQPGGITATWTFPTK
ncbi:unnamed protein product [Lampetra planeri]